MTVSPRNNLKNTQPRRHRASMNEVALRAGVSHQTVSRVINKSPNVAEATRRKVNAVIEELNYRPSNSARALVTQHTKTVGFIASGVNYYGPISTITAVESVAREHGFYLSVAILDETNFSQKTFEEVTDSFLEQGVEAFIILAPTAAMVEAAQAVKVNRPCVVLTSTHQKKSNESRKVSTDFVVSTSNENQMRFLGIDQYAAAANVVDYLADLGHQQCTFFAGPAQWCDAALRLKAWKQRAAEHGWKYEVVHLTSWEGSEAYEVAQKLFNHKTMKEMPTVVVAANDLQAFAVTKALTTAGIEVPQGVSVVGFDDVPGADLHTPALTTVRPDFEQLGRRAMRELLAMLGVTQAGEVDDESNQQMVAQAMSLPAENTAQGCLPSPRLTQLIVRESTAPPRL